MSPRRNNRAEDQNARYDRYADIFDNPVTAEVIEVGNRVLHGQFAENFRGSDREGVVRDRGEQAQRDGDQS
jgi:hypothetical protein